MVLDKLGNSLQDALKKLVKSGRIDKKIVDEIVKDIQRALLQSDVNVKLVLTMSQRIRSRALDEKLPQGINPREYLIKIVYDELIKIIGKSTNIQLKPQTIMMVGLQGSGKTTTTAKISRYFQRKGLKPAVICADTFRPGAYTQLKTLCERINVPFYGEEGNPDAVGIVKRGLEKIKKYEILIIDTAGRHSLESDLIQEMEEIHRIALPEHKLLVLDAAIGNLAREQARVFDESIGITGIVITKLDGTAKGGGALSAVSETNSSIAFIGVGETIEDIELFDANGFISRLLGMGDIKSLLEKIESLDKEDIDLESMMKGKFTLKDMYTQMKALGKMGPLKQVMQMLPLGGLSGKISDGAYGDTERKLKQYKVIMDSMTDSEMIDPNIIGSSRIKRISRGAGCKEEVVRELLKHHKMMQNAMKGMKNMGKQSNIQKMMKKLGM